MGPGGTRGAVASCQMDSHNQIPIRIRHVAESNVTEDTGIVDEYINSTKGANRRVNDSTTKLDGIVVWLRNAAFGADFLYNEVGCLFFFLRLCLAFLG
jgi:hypothetical protein